MNLYLFPVGKYHHLVIHSGFTSGILFFHVFHEFRAPGGWWCAYLYKKHRGIVLEVDTPVSNRMYTLFSYSHGFNYNTYTLFGGHIYIECNWMTRPFPLFKLTWDRGLVLSIGAIYLRIEVR